MGLILFYVCAPTMAATEHISGSPMAIAQAWHELCAGIDRERGRQERRGTEASASRVHEPERKASMA